MTETNKAGRMLAQEAAQADALNAKRFKFLMENMGALRGQSTFTTDDTGHTFVTFENLYLLKCAGCDKAMQCNHEDLLPMVDRLMKLEGL